MQFTFCKTCSCTWLDGTPPLRQHTAEHAELKCDAPSITTMDGAGMFARLVASRVPLGYSATENDDGSVRVWTPAASAPMTIRSVNERRTR